ncbi:Glycosyltransferase involved in cell wall bisynthesis [Zobellia uliginosa]|uniref:Glycosyltransferase involved in cell wall bisynthesis n=1 Tax=Zobellia uliginosa TaxID=143224 RepID=A0ABY1KM62_9FLAO|nr:glycosyltransferase family 4 protein [Zobellia uliginosa]SIS37071.1 Glycosyltransferase involved in cell wall bisynthesis [Zobellia uliginosa]
MRIDFVISNLGSDGAQRVVATLANYFSEKGHKIRIITFREGDRYQLNPSVERVRLHDTLMIFDSNLVRAAWHLSDFYRKKSNRPDIISSHIHTMGLVTIPISRLYGIKLVVSEHNNFQATKVSLKKRILWDFLYRFPDTVTILTSFDKAFFEKRNKNVIVMPNPLSFEPSLGLEDRSDKTIVVAGNLDRFHHKGFDNLMYIVAGVVKKHADWQFKIVGDGAKGLSILRAKAEELGVAEAIEFAGYRSDIKEILQTSEIFMLCSRYEGLPMVLMEAASQGIACIAYDCISGPSEIIQDGRSGLLVNNQDVDDMVRKTNILIENRTLRKELGQNATKDVEKFSIDKIGQKWQDIFNRLVPNSFQN